MLATSILIFCGCFSVLSVYAHHRAHKPAALVLQLVAGTCAVMAVVCAVFQQTLGLPSPALPFLVAGAVGCGLLSLTLLEEIGKTWGMIVGLYATLAAALFMLANTVIAIFNALR